MSFKIMPNNQRDTVYSIDVIDHSKINYFNTYNNILTQQKQIDMDDRDSDFYNVTVNLVVRRIPQYEADLKMKQD